MNDTHNVLELGVNDGVSTVLFAYYAKSVTGIDIHKSQKLENNLNLHDNISFKQGDIELVVPELPNNYFDFIYIDAAHDKSSVLRDIKLALPKLKTNGVICGHDYMEQEDQIRGVFEAVNEFFKDKKVNIFEDTSWSIQI
jgi:predicted O-methyltransferase YrrM